MQIFNPASRQGKFAMPIRQSRAQSHLERGSSASGISEELFYFRQSVKDINLEKKQGPRTTAH